MEFWKLDRIGACERNESPVLIIKMVSGFAVMGDHQFLPGYCVLMGYPKVNSLNKLSIAMRKQYLLDMSLVGDAIIKACNPIRINYSTLMNSDSYLHTHIEARYEWEPAEYKSRPSYFYPSEQRFGHDYEYNEEKHGELKYKIYCALKDLMHSAYL